jgi:tRNA(Ile)-lysidine synthase
LAGMSAVRELAGCRLVRPLLAVPRARLAALLVAERQPFLTDPSNLNPRFERARIRLGEIVIPGRRAAANSEADRTNAGAAGSALCPSARPATTIEDVLAKTQDYGGRRIVREAVLDRLIGRAVALHPSGFAVIDPSPLNAADEETVGQLLARAARCVGGGGGSSSSNSSGYPPRRARLDRLRVGLRADPQRARTLGGCRFVPWRGRVLVLRELAAAAPPVIIAPGERVLWDRRFAVSLAANADCSFRLDYLRRSAVMLVEHPRTGPPRLVDPTLPALWDAAGLAAVLHLGYRRAGVVGTLPALSFRPANPLTRAGFFP